MGRSDPEKWQGLTQKLVKTDPPKMGSHQKYEKNWLRRVGRTDPKTWEGLTQKMRRIDSEKWKELTQKHGKI